MGKILTSHWLVGLVMLVIGLIYHRTDHDWIEMLRHQTFDLYQRIQPRIPNPDDMAAKVMIVDIDEPALQAIGQWPWPRVKLAELVDKLTAYDVAVIGFDVVFSEADRTSPDKVILDRPEINEEIKSILRKLPTNEQIFAEAIAKSRVVLGQVGVHQKTANIKPPPKVGYGYLAQNPERDIIAMLNKYDGLVNNLPELEEKATGVGLFSTNPGYGGTLRKVALLERINQYIYPSLSLEMLRVALGGEDDYLIKGFKDGTAGISSIIVKSRNPAIHFEIPTDPHGQVWVHYARYPTSKPPLYISARDVLLATGEEQQKLHQRLANKLVIIGTSAVGLKDIRKTPISDIMPGVEVHAQLLETILADAHLTRPFEAIMIEWGLILFGGILMILLVPRLNALWTFTLSASLILLLIATAWYYYIEHRELIDASYPSLCIFSMFLALSYLNYMREERDKQQVRNAFNHYVSPALLEELAGNPDALSLGGETRNITVLFSDIRGFTTISERFNAQELTRFINKFLTPMTNVILDNKGTIDKYMGDAIMAFWNAPLKVPDHPKHACNAALEMQKEVKALNRKLQAESEKEQHKYAKENRRHYIPIRIGIGINTDDCCVGNMGSDQRFDYSALGDGVNLGARLEGQSKTYGVDIVLGPNTVARLDDEFAVIELDLIQVKGKTEPVHIYALLGDKTMRHTAEFESTKLIVEHMLNCYRTQQWDEAEQYANDLKYKEPSLVIFANLYLDRIAEYRKTPPPADWSGVFIATSK